MRLACVSLALAAALTAAADMTFTDLDSARAAGAEVYGPAATVAGEPRALALPEGAYLTFPAAEAFDPERGSLQLSVRPDWSGSDPQRHTFLHLGTNEAVAHVTLFATEGGTLRFVYKSSADAWLGVDVPIRDWEAGDWHEVTATWLRLGERMALGLRVGGAEPRWVFGGAPLAGVPGTAFLGARGRIGQFAQAQIAAFQLTREGLLALPYAAGAKAPLSVTIDCAGGGAPLPSVHDCVTIWNSRSVPLPFAIGSSKHRRLQEAGFRLARLVACSETWLWGVGITRDAQGQITLDFTDFDALIDMVRAAGLEPYIRIAYHMPKALSAEPNSPNWAYTGPGDYDEWAAFVTAVVKHCNVERKLGVKYWVMTLNEADIAVDAHGASWETICKLYETSVRAGKAIDPSIRVGGPAICRPLDGTGGSALRDFVAFCRDRDLPLDFICFHRYHVAHPRDFETHINAVRDIVDQTNPDLQPEYILDEWNQWARDRQADDHRGAAYVAAALQYFRRAGLTKASIVSFNDILEFTDKDVDLAVHRGPFDKTEGQAARFLAAQRAAGDDTRRCIVAHSPTGASYTFGRFEVDVPAEGNPRLTFATGITATYEGMDGVGFAVAATADGETRVLFTHGQRQSAWEDHEVKLEDYAGKRVTIEFRTDRGPAPAANGVADWASWADPRLVTGPDAQIAYDFIDHIADATTGVHQAPTRFIYDEDAIAASTGLPLIKGNVMTAPYFVFLAQSRLTGNQLPVTGIGPGGIDETDAAGVLATGDSTGARAVVWTYDLLGVGQREVELRFENVAELLAVRNVRVRRYLIDETHTNPVHDYLDARKPDNGGRYNLEDAELALVSDEQVECAADGSVTVAAVLPDFSVMLVEIERG